VKKLIVSEKSTKIMDEEAATPRRYGILRVGIDSIAILPPNFLSPARSQRLASKRGHPRSIGAGEKSLSKRPSKDKRKHQKEGEDHLGCGEPEQVVRHNSEELMKLRVVKLRAMLKALGRSTAGRKDQLVLALLQAQSLEEEQEEEQEQEQEQQEEQEDYGHLQKEDGDQEEEGENVGASSEESFGDLPMADGGSEEKQEDCTKTQNSSARMPQAPSHDLVVDQEEQANEVQSRLKQEEKKVALSSKEEEEPNEVEVESMNQVQPQRRDPANGRESWIGPLILLLVILLAFAAFNGTREGTLGIGQAVGLGVAGLSAGIGLIGGQVYLQHRQQRENVKAAIARLDTSRLALGNFLEQLALKRDLIKLQLEEHDHPQDTKKKPLKPRDRLVTDLTRLSALEHQKRNTLRNLDRQVFCSAFSHCPSNSSMSVL